MLFGAILFKLWLVGAVLAAPLLDLGSKTSPSDAAGPAVPAPQDPQSSPVPGNSAPPDEPIIPSPPISQPPAKPTFSAPTPTKDPSPVTDGGATPSSPVAAPSSPPPSPSFTPVTPDKPSPPPSSSPSPSSVAITVASSAVAPSIPPSSVNTTPANTIVSPPPSSAMTPPSSVNVPPAHTSASSAPVASATSSATPTAAPSSASSSSATPSQSASQTQGVSPAPSPTTGLTEIAEYLDGHNTVRAAHGAAPLSWSDDLANKATTWASECQFQNTGGQFGPFGENLVAGTGAFTPTKAVAQFTAEIYDAQNPTFNHLTQVVWKATTELGCGVAQCDNILSRAAAYHVCFYNPVGNVIGQEHLESQDIPKDIIWHILIAYSTPWHLVHLPSDSLSSLSCEP
ncbi:hypothetical protein EUX98_g5385 [Antrodiella citrinella]|uniref:SCP domain-containing protein n=1 Tax=Antrodiella citrinella TaxID=2447956 RepID=A0A4S4MUE6_9APHY|nr:hypothetical protein EUX98_g5385 [Antrodiella citrinella]